jgi:hypothetical protein
MSWVSLVFAFIGVVGDVDHGFARTGISGSEELVEADFEMALQGTHRDVEARADRNEKDDFRKCHAQMRGKPSQLAGVPGAF